jgi:hypothetical protein
LAPVGTQLRPLDPLAPVQICVPGFERGGGLQICVPGFGGGGEGLFRVLLQPPGRLPSRPRLSSRVSETERGELSASSRGWWWWNPGPRAPRFSSQGCPLGWGSIVQRRKPGASEKTGKRWQREWPNESQKIVTFGSLWDGALLWAWPRAQGRRVAGPAAPRVAVPKVAR